MFRWPRHNATAHGLPNCRRCPLLGPTSECESMAIYTSPATRHGLSAWQQCLQHPKKLWMDRFFFQIYLWVGMMAGLYLLVMSISGSAIVFRNELENSANFNGNIFRAV